MIQSQCGVADSDVTKAARTLTLLITEALERDPVLRQRLKLGNKAEVAVDLAIGIDSQTQKRTARFYVEIMGDGPE